MDFIWSYIHEDHSYDGALLLYIHKSKQKHGSTHIRYKDTSPAFILKTQKLSSKWVIADVRSINKRFTKRQLILPLNPIMNPVEKAVYLKS